jgi:hypothetical protein
MIDTNVRWQDEVMVTGGNPSDDRIVAERPQLSPGLGGKYI